jgi:hypothetical protein
MSKVLYVLRFESKSYNLAGTRYFDLQYCWKVFCSQNDDRVNKTILIENFVQHLVDDYDFEIIDTITREFDLKVQ